MNPINYPAFELKKYNTTSGQIPCKEQSTEVEWNKNRFLIATNINTMIDK